MKADVFPHRPAPAKLRIPSWVPRAVAAKARASYVEVSALEPPKYAVVFTKYLFLLIRDQRMRIVWRELQRRERTGAYIHPATRSIMAMDDDDRQAAAMVQLFNATFGYAVAPGVTVTQRRAEQRRNDLRKKARAMRIDAVCGAFGEAVSFGSGRNIWTDERRQRLVAAAETYETIAAETYAADMKDSVQRDSVDRSARWLARAVSAQFQHLFGSAFYGLTATIVSVVLGREIDTGVVRQWCSPPCS